MHLLRPAYLALGMTVASVSHASAVEFYVGGPETKNGMEIVGNYLGAIRLGCG